MFERPYNKKARDLKKKRTIKKWDKPGGDK